MMYVTELKCYEPVALFQMLESFLCLRIRNITKETEAPKRDKAPRAEREKLMSRRDRKVSASIISASA